MYPRSIFSDFILLVHTHSSRQMLFLAQALYRAARDADVAARNRRALSVERGRGGDEWVMVDMGHVMVHLFNGQRGEVRWGLDYHEVDRVRVEELRGEGKELEGEGVGVGGVGERRRGRGDPHPVEENIERQFGDLRVPVERYDAVQDYHHGDAVQGEADVSVVQEVRGAGG